MINNIKTKELYNYTYEDLPQYSKYEVVFICDFCNKNFIRPKVQITSGNKPGKHCCGSKECRQAKIIETNLTNSGYSNPMHNPNTQQKLKSVIQQKYGVDNISKNQDIINKKRNTYRKKHNGKLIKEWASIKKKANSTLGQQIKKYGFDIAINLCKQKTGIQTKIENFLTSQKINYIAEYKIENYRADILIKPNLILELNGTYWHSDKWITNKNYHRNKLKCYNNNQLQALFFYEDEINNQFDIVCSIINNKLHKSNKIYARKCQLIFPNKLIAKDFFSHNHLMKNGQGQSIGLSYNNELVALMQIIIKKQHIEISRFCNKLNYSVIGGFSKILSCIQSKYPKHDIHTFIDQRYGSGYYLLDLGFKPNKTHLSFQWINCKTAKRLHRLTYPNNTGYQYGCYKLWDCGQTKYIKYAK